MTNPVQPQACEILSVKKESRHEWTFRVATDAKPAHGQFMQLSIPMIGEAPISVSAQGDGWLEFTIRSVGKVTNVIFEKEAGDTLFLRGPYGKGWPVEQFRDKHLVVITGGTGLAPVRSMLNMLAADPGFAKSVHLISGFKNEDGIVFHSELEAWKEKFSTIYALDNDAKEGWRTGLVTTFVKEIPFDSFDGDYAVVVVAPSHDEVHRPGADEQRRGRRKGVDELRAQDVLRRGQVRPLPHRRGIRVPGRPRVPLHGGPGSGGLRKERVKDES